MFLILETVYTSNQDGEDKSFIGHGEFNDLWDAKMFGQKLARQGHGRILQIIGAEGHVIAEYVNWLNNWNESL